MSDWLNDNLDWEHGEDFNKIEILKNEDIEEDPGDIEEAAHDPDWESLLCKTDRETLAGYLVWMADYIEARRDGNTKTDNRVRITRQLAKKLRK